MGLFAAQHGFQSHQGEAELRDALLEKRLAGQVAQHLAAQTGAGGRKGLGQRQVGVFGLLGKFVVLEMVGAIGDQVRANRRTGQPLAEEIVRFAHRMQQPVGGVVHQDRQAELAPTDEDDRDQPREQMLTPCGGSHQRDADNPRMRDEPNSAPARRCRDRRPLAAVEKAVGREQANGGHGAVITSCDAKRNSIHYGTITGLTSARR